MSTEEMKRIKRLLFQATNEKDGDLIKEYLADKIIWHEGYSSDNDSELIFEIPKQEFINAIILGEGSFRNRIKTVYLQIAEDNIVSTYFVLDEIHVDNFMGYPPTNNKIRYNAVYTARFEDGFIAEIWPMMDGIGFLKQISDK